MLRINIALVFFVAPLCLGLSTRSKAQAAPNWGWDTKYIVDDMSFSTSSGGGGGGFDTTSPRAYAHSAGNNDSAHVLGVYRVVCTWQGSGKPGPFVYGGNAAINGSAKNVYPNYPGQTPGSGSSASSIGSMQASCPANYSIPFYGNTSQDNPGMSSTVEMRFQVEASASGNSCSTVATSEIFPR